MLQLSWASSYSMTRYSRVNAEESWELKREVLTRIRKPGFGGFSLGGDGWNILDYCIFWRLEAALLGHCEWHKEDSCGWDVFSSLLLSGRGGQGIAFEFLKSYSVNRGLQQKSTRWLCRLLDSAVLCLLPELSTQSQAKTFPSKFICNMLPGFQADGTRMLGLQVHKSVSVV